MPEQAWHPGCVRVESANCDARPDGAQPDLVVLHSISLPPGEYGGDAVPRLFTNTLDTAAHPSFPALAGLRVSAHFFIRRQGTTVQFVPVGLRAWHAGISAWRGRARCNDHSIGIELEGLEGEPFSDMQYAALAHLLRELRLHHPVLRAIAAHSDIAPERKRDPGAGFDWGLLLRALAQPQG